MELGVGTMENTLKYNNETHFPKQKQSNIGILDSRYKDEDDYSFGEEGIASIAEQYVVSYTVVMYVKQEKITVCLVLQGDTTEMAASLLCD